MVRISEGPAAFTVLQQREGLAPLELAGSVGTDVAGTPFLLADDEVGGRNLLFETLPPGQTWRRAFSLPVGIHRLQTGRLLPETGFSRLYRGRGDTLRHICAGEVFLIAGQSNAAGYGLQDEMDSLDAPALGVSLYDGGAWRLAAHPVGEAAHGMPNAASLACGHSPWLRLGRYLLSSSVPAGLVPVALNGSAMDEWGPGTPLRAHLMDSLKATGGRNLVWYQGCSDVRGDLPDTYADKLVSLILEARGVVPDLRVYVVQISGVTNRDTPREGWTRIREAQRQAALATGAALIPAYDLNRYSDDIHLGAASNLALAKRVYRAFTGERFPTALRAWREEGAVLLETDAPVLDLPLMPEALDGRGRPLPGRWERGGPGLVFRLPDAYAARSLKMDPGHYADVPFGGGDATPPNAFQMEINSRGC